MKAVQIDGYSKTLQVAVRDVPVPKAGEGEVLNGEKGGQGISIHLCSFRWRTTEKGQLLRVATGWGAMLAGCAIFSFGASVFLVPNDIVTGGMTELATLIHILWERVPVGVCSILLNIPVLILGFLFAGKKYTLNFIPSVVFLGLSTDLFSLVPPITDDMIMAAVCGGLLCGAGSGLLIRNGFGGGTELLGRVIANIIKTQNISLWVGICDGAIVLAGAAALVSFKKAFYGIATVFLSTKTSGFVTFGLKRSKLCIVISDKGKDIASELIAGSKRGITMLRGVGMYTSNEHQLLLTCIYRNQIKFLKETVRRIDGSAFVIVTESSEVLGKGFGQL